MFLDRIEISEGSIWSGAKQHVISPSQWYTHSHAFASSQKRHSRRLPTACERCFALRNFRFNALTDYMFSYGTSLH